MRKALRRAGWTLAAGLFGLAGAARAQYAAHPPGTVVAAPQQYVVSVPQSTYYTPDARPGQEVLRPVGATQSPTTMTGVPTGYVVQTMSPTMPTASHGTMMTTAVPAGYVVQAAQPATAAAPAAVPDPMMRLEEMKVELALLGDAGTFSCGLMAHQEGEALQIRGFVPNEAIRDRALAVARGATSFPIADGLKIHPRLAMRSAGVSPEILQQAVADALRKAFPEVADGLAVKTTITGQVTVAGTAHSFEEKLEISRHLRCVSGCMCVNNQVNVPGMPAATPNMNITAEGQQKVPTETLGQPQAVTAPNPMNTPATLLPAAPATQAPQMQVPAAIPQGTGAPAVDPLTSPPPAPGNPAPAAQPAAPQTLPPSVPPATPPAQQAQPPAPPAATPVPAPTPGASSNLKPALSRLPPVITTSTGDVTTGTVTFTSGEIESKEPPANQH
jgi:hypothetical protein